MRNDLRDGLAMCDELIFAGVFHRGEAEQCGVVAEIAQQGGFADGLVGLADRAADADEFVLAIGRGIGAVHFLPGELQDGLEQAGLADFKLRGVDADGQSARAGGDVVAQERPLAALVELSGGIERERVGGNGDAFGECLSNRVIHVATPQSIFSIPRFKMRRFSEI